jgi:hypothetical protein
LTRAKRPVSDVNPANDRKIAYGSKGSVARGQVVRKQLFGRWPVCGDLHRPGFGHLLTYASAGRAAGTDWKLTLAGNYSTARIGQIRTARPQSKLSFPDLASAM